MQKIRKINYEYKKIGYSNDKFEHFNSCIFIRNAIFINRSKFNYMTKKKTAEEFNHIIPRDLKLTKEFQNYYKSKYIRSRSVILKK